MTIDPVYDLKDSWFSDILAQRAEAYPAKDAIVILASDGTEKQRLSYRDLHDQVESYAAGLVARDYSGSRAPVLFEPGAGFVIAFMVCLRAGVTAFPSHVTKPGRSTWDRLVAIARDSDVAANTPPSGLQGLSP